MSSSKKKSKAKLPKNNTLGYVGIALWDDGKYRASFRGKKLGAFATDVEAARAYDKAAYKALKDKANLNFPDEHIKAKAEKKVKKTNAPSALPEQSA